MIIKPQKSSMVFDIVKMTTDASILFTRAAREHTDDKNLIQSLSLANSVYYLNDEGDTLVKGVQNIDYSEWLDLIEENEKIVTWS